MNKYASVSLVSSGVSFTQVVLVLLLFSFFDTGAVNYVTSYGNLIFASYTFFFQTFLLFFCFVCLILTKNFLKSREVFLYEYCVIIIFSLIGLSLLCSSNDLLILFLAIELQSLAFYLLAAFQWNSEFSSEAGIKYFVLGSFSSCLLLFGFSMIYLGSGSCSLSALQTLNVEDNNFTTISLGFLFSLTALLFKVGAVPFHMWLCDVYEGSLTSVTLFFAVVPKLVLFYLLLKLSFIVFSSYKAIWYSLFLFSGVFSVSLASIAALFQKKLKRLLAFSAISHTGFILLAISSSSLYSIKILVFYIFFYAIMTFGIFSVVLMSVNNQGFLKYLVNWSSLAKRNFVISISFSLILFSIAGIPPLAGFYSKLLVFFSLLLENNYFTVVLVSLLSCIACFYYIRLIKIFFFSESSHGYWILKASRPLEVCISLSVIVLTLFIIHPDIFLLTSSLVASSFM